MVNYTMDSTLQAERSVVGAIMIQPAEVMELVRSIVTEGDFYTDSARAVYVAARNLIDSQRPCDPVTIQSETGRLGTPVSTEYCAECMQLTPTIVNVTEYARIVHDAATSRKAQEIGLRLAEGEDTPVDGLAALQELLRQQSSTVHTPREAAQIVMDYISDAAAGKARPFISSGFGRLDRILSGGLVCGGLITLAARPGTGKTTGALCIAENVAAAGGKVLYISLEMTEEQLWACRLANVMGYSRSDIYQGLISDEKDWKVLADTMQMLSERELRIRDIPSSMEDIEREARCIPGLSLLVVDHMGLIRSTIRGSRYEIMTDIAHRLKQLALSLQIPVLALCQLNRDSVQRETRRPSMHDLRDSGAIEEDSDVVCLLFREAEYLPEKQRPAPDEWQSIDFIVDKNRHGETGITELAFCGEISSIKEWNE